MLQLGDVAFGSPSRISATVRRGKGEVIDIEREVELGGPLHSKGVLILAGFLGSRFGREDPLSLSASLVFEQSYGGVDGDSASSAELYALLSALAEVPLRQSLAVTGSVNQHGDGAGDRRRQREDRGLLRHLPRPGAERRPGRADSGGQRQQPDAARATWSTRWRRASSTFTR